MHWEMCGCIKDKETEHFQYVYCLEIEMEF